MQAITTRVLKVYGGASEKLQKEISLKDSDLEESLMSFLIKHNITIASSCSGAGSCKKCLVFYSDQEILSCQKSLRNLFSNDTIITIVINYL